MTSLHDWQVAKQIVFKSPMMAAVLATLAVLGSALLWGAVILGSLSIAWGGDSQDIFFGFFFGILGIACFFSIAIVISNSMTNERKKLEEMEREIARQKEQQERDARIKQEEEEHRERMERLKSEIESGAD